MKILNVREFHCCRMCGERLGEFEIGREVSQQEVSSREEIVRLGASRGWVRLVMSRPPDKRVFWLWLCSKCKGPTAEGLLAERGYVRETLVEPAPDKPKLFPETPYPRRKIFIRPEDD